MRSGTTRAVLALALVAAVAVACGRAPGKSDKTAARPEAAERTTRLFLASDGELTVVDVATGTSRTIRVRELAAGDPPVRVVRRGEKLVFYGVDTYAIDLDLQSPPEKLAESSFFVPSADPNRVWVAIVDPESPETVRALSAVREIAVDGRVTASGTPPPAWVESAVPGGLVFGARDGALKAWDPVRQKIMRALPGRYAGFPHGDRFPSCDDRLLYVTDVGTGARTSYEPPEGFAGFGCREAAFSPRGNLLAVPVLTRREVDAERALALVDLDRGTVMPVAGSDVEAGYVYVTWASTGESVFITGGERFERRSLLEYRLGAGRATRVPVELDDFYGIAAS